MAASIRSTAHSPLARLVGMAVDVQSEILIDRPCDLVAAYAADPSHAPDWYDNITPVEWHTPSPVQVGSRLAFVAGFLGQRLS